MGFIYHKQERTGAQCSGFVFQLPAGGQGVADEDIGGGGAANGAAGGRFQVISPPWAMVISLLWDSGADRK